MPRLAPLDLAKLTPEQKKVADAIVSGLFRCELAQAPCFQCASAPSDSGTLSFFGIVSAPLKSLAAFGESVDARKRLLILTELQAAETPLLRPPTNTRKWR